MAPFVREAAGRGSSSSVDVAAVVADVSLEADCCAVAVNTSYVTLVEFELEAEQQFNFPHLKITGDRIIHICHFIIAKSTCA